MKYTLRTTLAVTMSILALSLAGCQSGSTDQAVTINGEHGKVYTGNARQVSAQMGQDYAAGLRNMANQSAAKSQ